LEIPCVEEWFIVLSFNSLFYVVALLYFETWISIYFYFFLTFKLIWIRNQKKKKKKNWIKVTFWVEPNIKLNSRDSSALTAWILILDLFKVCFHLNSCFPCCLSIRISILCCFFVCQNYFWNPNLNKNK